VAIKGHKVMQKASLRVDTNLSKITQVLDWFAQFNHPPLGNDLWLQAKIALVEGFTNAVQHAHETLPQQTPIDLTVTVLADKLEISIWDQGPAFDLDGLIERVGQEHSDPLARDAHWGAVLFHKLRNQYGWQIDYRCPEKTLSDRNRLILQKEFEHN
jgi:serine/threonine-protein kinase RsbW